MEGHSSLSTEILPLLRHAK